MNSPLNKEFFNLEGYPPMRGYLRLLRGYGTKFNIGLRHSNACRILSILISQASYATNKNILVWVS